LLVSAGRMLVRRGRRRRRGLVGSMARRVSILGAEARSAGQGRMLRRPSHALALQQSGSNTVRVLRQHSYCTRTVDDSRAAMLCRKPSGHVLSAGLHHPGGQPCLRSSNWARRVNGLWSFVHSPLFQLSTICNQSNRHDSDSDHDRSRTPGRLAPLRHRQRPSRGVPPGRRHPRPLRIHPSRAGRDTGDVCLPARVGTGSDGS
jgi:hypothetical protein